METRTIASNPSLAITIRGSLPSHVTNLKHQQPQTSLITASIRRSRFVVGACGCADAVSAYNGHHAGFAVVLLALFATVASENTATRCTYNSLEGCQVFWYVGKGKAATGERCLSIHQESPFKSNATLSSCIKQGRIQCHVRTVLRHVQPVLPETFQQQWQQ